MKINVDKSLIKAVKTGKVIFGANRTVEAAANGSAKIVILASNCPEDIKKKTQETNVPIMEYEGTSVELGPVCGKPFTIAAMAILDVGESDILAATLAAIV
jgi:large subunit ribosomal protein L30e